MQNRSLTRRTTSAFSLQPTSFPLAYARRAGYKTTCLRSAAAAVTMARRGDTDLHSQGEVRRCEQPNGESS